MMHFFFSRKNWRICNVILLFAFLQCNSFSQVSDSLENNTVNGEDSSVQNETARDDTVAQNKKLFNISPDTLEHSPRKAMIYSLVLPGLGQGYNKKYFKIPIVYGALGGVAYWINYNNKGYRLAVVDYEADQSQINERYLRAWRRRLEISYLTLVATYALQVLDAYVDAHLYYWEVNPDLSVRVAPSSVIAPVLNYGVTCRLTF